MRLFLLIKLLIISLLLLIVSSSALGLESKAASILSIAVNKLTITYRGGLTINGSVTPAHNDAAVTLHQKTLGQSVYSETATATTNTGGAYSFTFQPSASCDLKVSWSGDGDHEGCESQTVRVYVKPIISIYQKSAKVPIRRKTLIYGYVAPNHQYKNIFLQRSSGRHWVNFKKGYVNNRSKYSFRFTLNKVRTYRFRVKFSDVDHKTQASKAKRIITFWPNPWGISKKIPKFIIVVRSRYRLYLIQKGNITHTFRVVVGKPSTRTPIATWKIGEKNPRYIGGVQGPLVLRLYRKSGSGFYRTRYGIHGTNHEELLGRWPRGYSHGCIRMYNRQILWLSARVPIGTGVRTI